MTMLDGYEQAEAVVRASAPPPWDQTAMGDRLRAANAGEIESPTFTVGEIPGGAAPIAYPGKVSGIAGDSGSGKSWTALAMAKAEAERGGYSLWIDYEDTADTLAVRMSELGWPEALGNFVIHFGAVGSSTAGMDGLLTAIEALNVTLIVIDSTGESMAGDGCKQNDEGEVALWFQELPRPLSNLGPAVVLIDHLVKDRETGGLWPSGSHRKRDAVTGIQYIVRTDETFSREKPGKVTLICAKDRGGHHAQGDQVAVIHFEPSAGVLHIVATPTTGVVSSANGYRKPTRPTTNMERVSALLEAATAPMTGRGIESAMKERGMSFSKGKPVLAAKVLVTEGYAATVEGARGLEYVTVRPYIAADDPVDQFGEEKAE